MLVLVLATSVATVVFCAPKGRPLDMIIYAFALQPDVCKPEDKCVLRSGHILELWQEIYGEVLV